MGAPVQYLGWSGYTDHCLVALDALLSSGSLPKEATIVSTGSPPSSQNHLFLLWDWYHFRVTVIPSGFSSGYHGQGPKGFSLALCMLRDKGVPLKHSDLPKDSFELIDSGRATFRFLQAVRADSEDLPFPFSPWTLDNHVRLLNAGRLRQAQHWREDRPDEVSSAIWCIEDFSGQAGLKLRLARTLANAGTVEAWQQVGLLVRDAWVEFATGVRLAHTTTSFEGMGANDVKGVITRIHLSEKLTKTSHGAYDLSNELQHDWGASQQQATSCLLASVAGMAAIVEGGRSNGTD